jgi:hypothetical protein
MQITRPPSLFVREWTKRIIADYLAGGGDPGRAHPGTP